MVVSAPRGNISPQGRAAWGEYCGCMGSVRVPGKAIPSGPTSTYRIDKRGERYEGICWRGGEGVLG